MMATTPYSILVVTAAFAMSAESVWTCWQCRYEWIRTGTVCGVCYLCSACMGMLAVHVLDGIVGSVCNISSVCCI